MFLKKNKILHEKLLYDYHNEMCMICMKYIKNDEIETKCKHKYHIKCLKSMIIYNDKCLICRKKIKLNMKNIFKIL